MTCPALWHPAAPHRSVAHSTRLPSAPQVRVPYAFEGPFTSGAHQANQETLWAQQAASSNGNGGAQYTVSVLIPKDMEPPVSLPCCCPAAAAARGRCTSC